MTRFAIQVQVARQNHEYTMTLKGDCFNAAPLHDDYRTTTVIGHDEPNSWGLAIPQYKDGKFTGEKFLGFKEGKKAEIEVESPIDFAKPELKIHKPGSKERIEAMRAMVEANEGKEDFTFFDLTDDDVASRLAGALVRMSAKVKNKIQDMQG